MLRAACLENIDPGNGETIGAVTLANQADVQAASEYGPYDRIIDSVGGQVLGSLLAMLAPT